MKIAVFLSLLFSLSQAASIAQDEPVFCHDLDCPKYTLVAKKTGYEIRNYAPSKWVSGTFTAITRLNHMDLIYSLSTYLGKFS